MEFLAKLEKTHRSWVLGWVTDTTTTYGINYQG